MSVHRALAGAARTARIKANLRQIDIATTAGVSSATVSRFEKSGHAEDVEALIEAYERECALPDRELWRRAVGG